MPHRQMHRRVVDFIVRQLGLPEAEHVVSTAVDRLALMPKRLRDLEDYLIAHPDALVSGRSDGPVSRLRLLDVLVESFPEQVVRARCAQCGRQTLVNRRGPGEGRICVSCYAANRIRRVWTVRPHANRRWQTLRVRTRLSRLHWHRPHPMA